MKLVCVNACIICVVIWAVDSSKFIRNRTHFWTIEIINYERFECLERSFAVFRNTVKIIESIKCWLAIPQMWVLAIGKWSDNVTYHVKSYGWKRKKKKEKKWEEEGIDDNDDDVDEEIDCENRKIWTLVFKSRTKCVDCVVYLCKINNSCLFKIYDQYFLIDSNSNSIRLQYCFFCIHHL